MRIARVRCLLERGRVFNSSGKPDRARPLFLQAVEAGTDAKLDGYVVDALHMLAIVEPEASAQHDWNCRAMALAEASSDPTARKWLATLYNNIGWTYYEQKRYDDAMDVFRKAIPLREQAGKVIPLRIAHYCVGKTLRAMGKIDDALAIQRRLHAEHQADGTPDGFVCEEIAECLLLKGHADEARQFFRRAYEILSRDEWLMNGEPQRVERLGQLAGDVGGASGKSNSSIDIHGKGG
jgi:tetratricopeptide (TPR) repeat protein